MPVKEDKDLQLEILEDHGLKLQANNSHSIELAEINLGYANVTSLPEPGFDHSVDLPSSLSDQWRIFYKSVAKGLSFTVIHKTKLFEVPLISITSPDWLVSKENELTGSLELGESISFLGDQGQGLVLSRFDQNLKIEPLIDSKIPKKGIIERSIEIGRMIAEFKHAIQSQPNLDQLFEEMDSWGGFTTVIEKAAFRELSACTDLLQIIDSPEKIDQQVMFYELEYTQQCKYLGDLWNLREKLEAFNFALSLLGEEASLTPALKQLDQRAETALTILQHLIDLPRLDSDQKLKQLWLESHPEAWWTILAA